jgi:hypothetical protein
MLWETIPNLENEPRYRHGKKSIKNISKNGNSIEREVGIAFKNLKCLEIGTEDYKESIKIKITSGPIQGRKTMMILTMMNLIWNVRHRRNVGIICQNSQKINCRRLLRKLYVGFQQQQHNLYL